MADAQEGRSTPRTCCELREKAAVAWRQHPWREPPGLPRRDSSRSRAPTLNAWGIANSATAVQPSGVNASPPHLRPPCFCSSFATACWIALGYHDRVISPLSNSGTEKNTRSRDVFFSSIVHSECRTARGSSALPRVVKNEQVDRAQELPVVPARDWRGKRNSRCRNDAA
jgi:hypothetical protein